MSVNARRDLPMATEIVATGYHRPALLVDNDGYFARCRFDLPGDRAALQRQTRMRTRSWCGPGETTFTMAKAAVAMALAEQPSLRDEIDVVLVASATTVPGPDAPEPEHAGMADLAPLVMRAIGRPQALGFDLRGVNCAGFLRGLQIMDGLLANPNLRAGLVVATERCSSIATAAGNRSPFCFVLGDAAGAAILRRRDGKADAVGLLDYVGDMKAELFHDMIILPDRASLFVRGATVGPATIQMLVASARTLLERNRLSLGDIDWFLPMQTHGGMVDEVCRALEMPAAKTLWRGDTTGFSGSASIGAALAEALQGGTIAKGQLVLSVAVGAGLSSAGALYRV